MGARFGYPARPMGSYFLRRLLLLPPTLIGITLLVFVITRLVPGGPLFGRLAQRSGF